MEGVHIRAPRPGDWQFYIDGVREILAQQGNTFTEDDLAEERAIFARLSREDRFLVAESAAGELWGYLLYEPGTCKPWLPTGRPTEPFAWVNVVYVSGRARGQGVGRLLYEHLEARLVREGCRRVLLDVYEVNAVSIAFHERIGCKTIAVVDKWRLGDAGGDGALVKLGVANREAGLLVASLDDGTEAARLRFQETRDCPYGVTYGEGSRVLCMSMC